MTKDLVSFAGLSGEELRGIFRTAAEMKLKPQETAGAMRRKTAALIFEKQSLRTHVSFQVGIAQLGGESVFLSQQHIGLSTRESVRDVAEVLSCYNDLIIARTMSHETAEQLARYATVPVINALTDLLHPCQILADAFTLIERGTFSEATKIAFIGDGNNIVNSWLELAEKLPFHFVLACPEGYEPDRAILDRASAAGVSRIDVCHDPFEAAEGAHVLYTDVWVSMGQEGEAEARMKAFRKFQINATLLDKADPSCVVMHCLPAHRGEEITPDVLEGTRSIVLHEAENRLHVQKAVIDVLMRNSVTTALRRDHMLQELTV
jgi:ornithine carbamoyltransferase